jgi:hypothetical protein
VFCVPELLCDESDRRGLSDLSIHEDKVDLEKWLDSDEEDVRKSKSKKKKKSAKVLQSVRTACLLA